MAAFWRRGREPVEPPKVRPAVCVSGEDIKDMHVGLTYDNSNITISPTAPWLDYRAI